MVVPNCHVQELITETQTDNWVRVTGVRVWQNGLSVDIPLAPPRNDGQSAVVIALGTVESTRIALTTFQQSLAGRAAQRMGTNLIAHLRSNLTIRIPKRPSKLICHRRRFQAFRVPRCSSRARRPMAAPSIPDHGQRPAETRH